MIEVLTNLQDAKLKDFRIKQLIQNKSKSSEEIQEFNNLVEEMEWVEEMAKEPEYAVMISEFTKGYSHSEDIDFIIGTFYGISASGILKKEMDDDRKKKSLKTCARMWLGIRNSAIEEMKNKNRSPMEQPKPYKPVKPK